MKHSCLDEIIVKVIKENNVLEDINIDRLLIYQQAKMNLPVTNGHTNLSLPLWAIKPIIVETLVQISNMCQYSPFLRKFSLSIVKLWDRGTENLILFEHYYSHEEDGTVGVWFWVELKIKYRLNIFQTRTKDLNFGA